MDLAPLTLCHGESHPFCSKCQAAKGLSCVFSYFGRNQPEGWGNGLKKQGSRGEDRRPQNRITEYPCLKDYLVACFLRHPRLQKLSHHGRESLFSFSNFFLVVSNLVSGFRDTPLWKLSDLNNHSLKTSYHLLLAFSVFRNTISSRSICQCGLIPCSLPLVFLYSQVQLKGCFI